MKSYFIKAVLLCSITCLCFYVIMYTYFQDVINTKSNKTSLFRNVSKYDRMKRKPMKYILQWTSSNNVPFVDMGKGQNGFLKRKCAQVNCYVTSDKYLLGDYLHFDVIAFAGPELSEVARKTIKLPKRRSLHQKYVFASIESPNYYPLCNNKFNGFFNWTWTYKLDSEVQWGYIVVRDMKNNIIGPKEDMNWLKLEEMEPVKEDFKNRLKTKKKAAAWFVSNCVTVQLREKFVRELQIELYRYNSVVDIYGKCGSFECSIDNEEVCNRKIADDYYFYLSFENSFSEDYVTEKLLRALNNNAVPIVYGGGNYSRFMPDNIYLNARELGVQKLAEKMNELMNDPAKYAEYFKWKNHYWYHKTTESTETNEYCRFCEILNDEGAVKKTTVYSNITGWWNDPYPCSQII